MSYISCREHSNTIYTRTPGYKGNIEEKLSSQGILFWGDSCYFSSVSTGKYKKYFGQISGRWK